MLFEGPAFIVAIVAICTGGWLINNWIRAKHGYPLEDEWGGKSALTDGDYPEVDRKVHLLTSENEQLTGKLSRLEERVASWSASQPTSLPDCQKKSRICAERQ